LYIVMDSVESYIGYFEMDAVFNGEPVEPAEEMCEWTKGASDNKCKEVLCSL